MEPQKQSDLIISSKTKNNLKGVLGINIHSETFDYYFSLSRYVHFYLNVW